MDVQAERKIARLEGCFITKAPCYMNQQVRWVNAIPERKANIEYFLWKQGIVPTGFHLDHISNLTNLDPMLYGAMVKFSMLAVTCSLQGLDAIIELVKAENIPFQEGVNSGCHYTRKLAFAPPVTEAQYNLVILSPTQFLLNKCRLRTYPQVGLSKEYAIANDGVLREYPAENNSSQFPTFPFDAPRKHHVHRLNALLVVLNADKQFRRYRRLYGKGSLHHHYEELSWTRRSRYQTCYITSLPLLWVLPGSS